MPTVVTLQRLPDCCVKKRQDAQLILALMLENRFPQIWVASWENRDLRVNG